MARLTSQLQRLQTVNEAARQSVQSNTQAVASSTTSSVGSSSPMGSTILKALGGGLAISPLISGVLRLFGGGGSSSEPAPLMKYALPGSVDVSAGVSRMASGAFGVDYGQGGIPRPVTMPQITVQVQAMDSRSFLDHSNDIALAVRQAMLESSVLSDVVREV
jgi:hypothetical protein